MVAISPVSKVATSLVHSRAAIVPAITMAVRMVAISPVSKAAISLARVATTIVADIITTVAATTTVVISSALQAMIPMRSIA